MNAAASSGWGIISMNELGLVGAEGPCAGFKSDGGAARSRAAPNMENRTDSREGPVEGAGDPWGTCSCSGSLECAKAIATDGWNGLAAGQAANEEAAKVSASVGREWSTCATETGAPVHRTWGPKSLAPLRHGPVWRTADPARAPLDRRE
jgi:hypothetical protein